MKKIEAKLRRKQELQQLVAQMDDYQVRLVLAFVIELFGVYDDVEEAKKAA